MAGVDGLKTGFTNASGFNLAGLGRARQPPPDRRGAGRPDRPPAATTTPRACCSPASTCWTAAPAASRSPSPQNLFEPPQLAALTRPSIEQGDTDQAGLKIVLASAPPPAAPSKIQIVEPSSAPKLNGKAQEGPAAAGPSRSGAFKSNRSDASEQLAIVEKRFGQARRRRRRPRPRRTTARYRARFSGLTEAEAERLPGDQGQAALRGDRPGRSNRRSRKRSRGPCAATVLSAAPLSPRPERARFASRTGYLPALSSRSRAALSWAARPAVPPLSGWASAHQAGVGRLDLGRRGARARRPGCERASSALIRRGRGARRRRRSRLPRRGREPQAHHDQHDRGAPAAAHAGVGRGGEGRRATARRQRSAIRAASARACRGVAQT